MTVQRRDMREGPEEREVMRLWVIDEELNSGTWKEFTTAFTFSVFTESDDSGKKEALMP